MHPAGEEPTESTWEKEVKEEDLWPPLVYLTSWSSRPPAGCFWGEISRILTQSSAKLLRKNADTKTKTTNDAS